MYYTGGLVGYQLVQQTIYTYNYTPGDSDANWSHFYNGIMAQNKIIREKSPNSDGLLGIIDVNEAMSLGTAATIWGDVPYSTAVPDNAGLGVYPSYDSQADVSKDDSNIQTFCDKLKIVPGKIKNIVRLGKRKAEASARPRPVEIHLASNYDRRITLSNCHLLMGTEVFF